MSLDRRIKQGHYNHGPEEIAAGDDLSNLHGKAKFSRKYNVNLQQLSDVKAEKNGWAGFPLGRDSRNPDCGLFWVPQLQQGHGLTFGSTRSGKGVTAIIPALLAYSGGSCLVIDPKGENAWITAERRRSLGDRVVILDPWDEVNRRYGSKAGVQEQTTTFNPLGALDPSSPDFADDVAAIADALIIPGMGDPHWTDSARELIAGLVAAVAEEKPGMASLRDVRECVTSDESQIADMIERRTLANPNSVAVKKLRRFAKGGREVDSVRAVAETQTAFLDSKRLLDAMTTGKPAFNLDELATGKVCLFLVLPLDRLQTHGRWLRLIITLALRTIARQETPPANPITFLLDEMGTIGKLTMVEQAFGLMAGIGVRIWGFLQDLSQLKRDYPDSWETFISNSSVIQALKVSDITTSEYLSQLLGTTTLERVSLLNQKIRDLGRGYKTMNDLIFARPLMLPQEIRGISSDMSLNIIPELGNFYTKRMPYGHFE